MSQKARVGATARFTAAARGTPAPTVQWQVRPKGARGFSDMRGADRPTLILSAVAATQDGSRYRAVFSNAAGRAVSRAAILRIDSPPVVLDPPAGTSGVAGGYVAFRARARGSPRPAIQWQVSRDKGRTFRDIPGATREELTVVATIAADGYRYRAVFTNAIGSATTAPATLTVVKR